MTRHRLITARRCDTLVEIIVGTLLVFAPLAYGTTEFWSQEIFVLAVAAAAIVVAFKHVWKGGAIAYRRSWIYIPMLLFLAVCALQIIPLPAGVLRLISPGTLRLKSELLSDLPAAVSQRFTLSFYPHATLTQAVLVASIIALFAVVADVYQDAARIRRLLSVIACVGLAVAGLAVYQNLTHASTVYGLVPAGHRNAGPFMNYSHFSQFMNMSVGAAMALLLVGIVELSDYYRTPSELVSALRQPRNAMLWVAAFTCVLGPITIFLCMSRMGMLSMLVSAAVTGALLAWRGRSPWRDSGDRGGHTLILFFVAILVFAVLLYAGFDVVYARLATVRHFQQTGGSRTQILRDMLPIFRQFPLLGTGLGTHEFVFPMFDRLNIPLIATHAENEYAQLMEETGVVGVLLAAAFIGFIIRCFARVIRRPRQPIDYAAFGLGFGLLAILIHSGSDFGQHDPADAALTAIFVALLWNLSTNDKIVMPLKNAPSATIGRVALLCGVILAAVAGGWWTDRARAAESQWVTAQRNAADLQAAGWVGDDAAFIDLLKPASAAVALEPGNVVYRYWTDVYRWRTIAREVDPTTGAVRLPAAAVGFAAQIVDDLQHTRLLCPTYGPPLCVAGQINLSVLNRPDLGRREVDEAARLTRYDPTVSLVQGMLAVGDGRWPDAQAALSRYVLLGGTANDFTDVLLHKGHPEICYAIARGHRSALQYLLSRMPAQDPAWTAWRERCQRDVDKLLTQEVAASDATPEALVELAEADAHAGRSVEAIGLYQRALQAEYGQAGWHLRLAQLLFDTGRYTDAAREARVSLELRPQSSEAETLLRRALAKGEKK